MTPIRPSLTMTHEPNNEWMGLPYRQLPVVHVRWAVPPVSAAKEPNVFRCGSCNEKPRVGVGVLEVLADSQVVLICPYCLLAAIWKSLGDGVRIEIDSQQ